MPTSWKALYDSRVMAVWALMALPALFLVVVAVRGFTARAGIEPYAARFVRTWAIVFAALSVVDPVATGIFGVPFLPFVLIGDYRVFVLLIVVMQPGRSRAGALLEAAGWTLVVPVVAFATTRALGLVAGPLPETTLWIVYETAFAVLALAWIARVVPARVGIARRAVRGFVRTVLAYVVVYYVLWAAADVLVLRGGEWGWGVRIVANLLYYGAFVPFACWRFFATTNAASSTSVQAAR